MSYYYGTTRTPLAALTQKVEFLAKKMAEQEGEMEVLRNALERAGIATKPKTREKLPQERKAEIMRLAIKQAKQFREENYPHETETFRERRLHEAVADWERHKSSRKSLEGQKRG